MNNMKNLKISEETHAKLKLQSFARKMKIYEYVEKILQKELKYNKKK